VIREIRKRLDYHKGKVKKNGLSAQISSSKVISSYKKLSTNQYSREEQESKIAGELLKSATRSSKDKETEAVKNGTGKPTTKKAGSIPYLKAALVRA
jgi:hypothetical protein